MSSLIAHLGSHPLLAIAELVQQGYDGKRIHQSFFALNGAVDTPQKTLNRLGGTIKFSQTCMCVEKETCTPHYLQTVLESYTPATIAWYPLASRSQVVTTNYQRQATKGMTLQRPRRPDVPQLPSQETALLLKKGKTELNVIEENTTIRITKTIAVQNVDSYTQRDMDRPHLLKKTGMFPPKLAQIVINLVGKKTGVLIDPFCGSGLVLQEASLLGFATFGIDLHPRTVELARENLEWAEKTLKLQPCNWKNNIKHGNATDLHGYKKFAQKFDAVVTEGELGPNFSRRPTPELLAKIIPELTKLQIDFLRAIAPSLKDGARLVLCFPYWRDPKEHDWTKQQRILPSISSKFNTLGYTLIPILPKDVLGTAYQTLGYDRPQQFVGREVCILEKSTQQHNKKTH